MQQTLLRALLLRQINNPVNRTRSSRKPMKKYIIENFLSFFLLYCMKDRKIVCSANLLVLPVKIC